MSADPAGDFDVPGFLARSGAYLDRMERLQDDMAGVVGRARDEDELVVAEFGAGGLTALELHPKAMRLSSGELAERIKDVVRAAAADQQRRLAELMDDALGAANNPLRLGPEAALAQMRQAQAAYDRTYGDVMGELERISRRLDG